MATTATAMKAHRDARDHQPRRDPGELGGEAAADQRDQRDHYQRVRQQVGHVEHMAPGQHGMPLGRADLLEDEYHKHESDHGRPGKLELCGENGPDRPELAEHPPAVPGQPGGDDGHGEGRQVEPPPGSLAGRRSGQLIVGGGDLRNTAARNARHIAALARQARRSGAGRASLMTRPGSPPRFRASTQLAALLLIFGALPRRLIPRRRGLPA
jgi:hypothetical protein